MAHFAFSFRAASTMAQPQGMLWSPAHRPTWAMCLQAAQILQQAHVALIVVMGDPPP